MNKINKYFSFIAHVRRQGTDLQSFLGVEKSELPAARRALKNFFSWVGNFYQPGEGFCHRGTWGAYLRLYDGAYEDAPER